MPYLLFLGTALILIFLCIRYLMFKSMTEKVCSLEPDNDYCRKHYNKNLDKSNDPYIKCDIMYGETPHGGNKTIICYMDSNNKMTSKEKAVKVMVRELDKNKHVVYETW
ncbi:MAG: hypothetical protein NUK65_12030, partial [Firmicutes bacterium]|nr:hypothetical protein [Bacillota bacterium]